MKRPSKTKASSLSHKEMIAQIAAENRAYFAKLDEKESDVHPPQFIIEPQDVRITEGQTACFTAKAIGAPSPTYQWFVVDRDNSGVVLTSETNPKLVVSNPELGVSRYIVSATNKAGIAQSRVANLFTMSKETFADEIKAQKLKDAETVRQILNAQSHRQTSICPPHPAPDRSAYSSISTGGSLCNQSNRWPRLPEKNAKNPSRPMDSGLKKVIWGIAGVLGVLFIIGWISSLHDTGVDNDFAVASAERFVRQAYPGAQSFLPDNHVVHNQDEFAVSLTANGVNSFNAPVQNAFLVIMRETKPGTLTMVEIDQK